MKNWLTRHREAIMPLLVLAAVTLILANLLRHGLLTPSILAANKDALAALNSAVGVIVIVVGGIFSYYRFFRGRTFFSRAELKVSVVVIETTEDFNIHAVTVEVKNIGTLSIWEPTPYVRVDQYGPRGRKTDQWANWTEASGPGVETEMLTVIDSGETAAFICQHQVEKSIWSVTYVAFVKSREREIWKASTTVANKSKAPITGEALSR
jgi:hypothetical protein